MGYYKVKRFSAREAIYWRDFLSRLCPGMESAMVYPCANNKWFIRFIRDDVRQVLTVNGFFANESLVDF